MKSYILHAPDGTIRAAIEASDPTQLVGHELAQPGDAWTQTPFPPWDYEIVIVDDVPTPVARSIDPSLALEQARAIKTVAADAYLTQVLAAGYTASIGIVQCDAAARINIDDRLQDALAAAQVGEPWADRWRLMDNSMSDELDAAGMIAFAREVKSYVQACRVACWARKDAIRAADTADALAAVDITAGYPERGSA